MTKSIVYLVKTDDRSAGTRRCLGYMPLPDYAGKTIYVKPNFNSADPPPGSTHNDTLDALLEAVRAKSPSKIILGERSGPVEMADVFEQKGIGPICEKYGATFVNFEALPDDEWVAIERPGLHWPESSISAPRVVLEADACVATCCLKTHGFGGVFSSALKLAVGLVPKDFQTLHSSPHMRKMLAETNLAYTPDLVIVDAVEVFTDGGPMTGTRAKAGLMLAGSDRIALDAVGLAVLRSLGSNDAIMNTEIFEQEQIARAVELGLGVSSADEIEIVTDDAESAAAADRVAGFLRCS